MKQEIGEGKCRELWHLISNEAILQSLQVEVTEQVDVTTDLDVSIRTGGLWQPSPLRIHPGPDHA